MAKLRPGQVWTMLLLSSAFSLVCQTSPYTLEGLLGAALAAGVGLLLSLPICWLYGKGFSLRRLMDRHKLLFWILLGFLLLRGGVSLAWLQGTTTALSLPFSGEFWAAALIALVCVYTASLGVSALARSSTLIFGIFLFTLGVMLIGAIPEAEPQNLALSPEDTVWQGFLYHLLRGDELVLLVFLLDLTDGKRWKCAAGLYGSKLFLTAFLTLLGMAVLGNRMYAAEHPFFAILAVSQPFQTQRADALYLVVYGMLCVLRITLYTALSAHLLKQRLPKLRYGSTLCLLGMLGAALL